MGGLTAGRGTVFPKEVIDLRLSDFRLWTAWTSCITPAFPLSCEAGKGKRRGQSAECSSCRMTQKGKSVTLTLYSSPGRAIPQPSARRAVKLKNPRAPKGQSILRTVPFTTLLHNLPPAGGHNPRGAALSTLTPKACPMPVALSFSVSMDYNKVVKFIRKMGKGACGTILPRAFSLICFIFPCSGRRLFFFLISRRIFYVQCGSTSCKRKMCRR